MYDIKALYEASSVNEAIELMRQHPEAKIIAGGSDVLIKLREGKLAGCELISIFGIDALSGISMDEDGTLRILPLTSFSHITKDPLINEHIKVLGEAVDMVGGPQIRNIGTIGGNISNGVTSADSASTLHAWDAIVELTSAEGVRQLPIKEYYISAGRVALRPAELLTAILIKKESYSGYKGHYIKYAMRNAMDIATLGCSVNVKLSDDKATILGARIAYGEEAVRGKPVCGETVAAFAGAAIQDINPRDSWRASREFRLHLAHELAKRALTESIRLSGGEI